MGKTAKLFSVPKERQMEALCARSAEIRDEFRACFSVSPGYPKTHEEPREGEAPHFDGLWVFGDGPGVVVDDTGAHVEAELLCNRALGERSYVQYEVRIEALDLRYKGDYAPYYRNRGRILKHIGKRLELFCAYSLLELHELVQRRGVEETTLGALFSPRHVKAVLMAFRVPIRFTGDLG
ncbi:MULTISPECIES: hypothetical protein [Sorangium]|uniref:Uncharacterized protein n=1 Tax=Sorangium cellulosum (strain So ce56) TaxID=448385 RepID=A9FPJ1_SORC5|nr:hypothetical protein [Sorangium cellulosum]CAN92064.1 hypothetical protein predicted by Glimmer/Critica [Sorangium cellulosum So ce56]